MSSFHPGIPVFSLPFAEGLLCLLCKSDRENPSFWSMVSHVPSKDTNPFPFHIHHGKNPKGIQQRKNERPSNSILNKCYNAGGSTCKTDPARSQSP